MCICKDKISRYEAALKNMSPFKVFDMYLIRWEYEVLISKERKKKSHFKIRNQSARDLVFF